MAARDWTELREINGTMYLIRFMEVDAHEGYISRSSHILREATDEECRTLNPGERINER
jgi:hypothetical protein